MEQFKTLIQEYGHKIDFRLALATALGCPFGEEIRTERVAEMVQFGLDLGCKEISIADTVGMSNPKRTYDLMNALTAQFGADQVRHASPRHPGPGSGQHPGRHATGRPQV